MQGKEIPDALAARALSVSSAGGAKGASRASAGPCPPSPCLILTSPCLILTSPPAAASRGSEAPVRVPCENLPDPGVKAAGRRSKLLSLCPRKGRGITASAWKWKGPRRAPPARPTAACLGRRAAEGVSGAGAVQPSAPLAAALIAQQQRCFTTDVLGSCLWPEK